MSSLRITPELYQLGSDDKISLIYAIDMALRNVDNPIVIKKFEKMRSKLLLTKDGKQRKIKA
jgi:hypothetical protein